MRRDIDGRKYRSGKARRSASLKRCWVLIPMLLAMDHADARPHNKVFELAACGGNALAHYVGGSVEDVRKLNLANSSFVCIENCATIADHRSGRLTVIYSKKTNLVTNMYCG